MQSTKTIIITAIILILTILGAGCTDTGGANPETMKYTAPQEEVAVVEETVASEPTPEPTETPWYLDGYEFGEADVGTYSNMFGEDIYAVKGASLSGIDYDLFDTQIKGMHILNHQEFNPSNFKLYNELSPDQYSASVDEYGSMRHITMETIDLDQDGAMDKVAVKYVGSDGVLEFETEYKNKYAQVIDYLATQFDW
ncbi:MAG: hypothetical protein Q7J10_08005 [Methanosarcinaceae archaeon]|nr:hypothetical protein [Methanosarcinaceae archaeon]